MLKLQADMAEKQKLHQERQEADTQSKLVQWNDTRNADVASIQAKLARIEGVDLDEQQRVFETMQELARSIRTNKSTLTSIERDKKDAATHLARLSGDLAHLHDATCPYCKQEFHDDAKIQSTQGDIEQLSEAVRLLDDEVMSLLQKIAADETALEEHRANLQFEDIQELLTIKFKREEMEATIERRTHEVNPFIAVLEMLAAQKPEETSYERMNELTVELEHQKFLLKLLTKNDSFIRKAMLNKNLPFLNKQLNYYLRRMGLPHIVEFTHDLTPKITRFGSEFAFEQLSTGQRARVNIALSLSFRDVLQNLHQRTNLFCVDEVLDSGLDAAGVITAAKLIKEEARKTGTCAFVISHREEISSSFDKKMYVIYKGGFSKTYQTEEDVEAAEQMLRAEA